ncbi:MAG: endonuclease III [Candidatus Melainabacteria bacterium GWA2_34_9]|nr:MAG: endonuclease III [Candidatus Melainabacteria bacterium GWA2_34_9]
MKKVDIEKIVEILDNYYPMHVMEDTYTGQPYKALVSCLLSLRTRDEITFPVAEKLFQAADNPCKMINLSYEELCEKIKSINYYKTKAENIQTISRILLEKYNGEVPSTMEELLAFRGVGRKTANIVLSVGFQKPAIAVDTHVHRISNRLGLVSTKTPEETEFALREILPKKYWRKWNQIMVLHGKNTCKPITPLCKTCPIIEYCNQVFS